MKRALILLLLTAGPVYSQVNEGELRLRITDPSGAAVSASVELISSGNGYDKSFTSDPSGVLDVRQVPYGVYQVQVRQPDFAPFSKTIEVRSPMPLEETIKLSVASVAAEINVTVPNTL